MKATFPAGLSENGVNGRCVPTMTALLFIARIPTAREIRRRTRMYEMQVKGKLHDPFSARAFEICGRAVLRADHLGMEHYGPAPPPLDESRDMYQEAIEELLDAIYYLTRQVARLEDQRERMKVIT